MSDTRPTLPDAAAVAAYLRRHPRFLSDYPDLVMNLSVPREDGGGATSLVSYQLDVLRDKNRELNRRLQELYANAVENERLTIRTHQLTLALMRADSELATLRTLVACLIEDFGSELVRILLVGAPRQLPESEWLQQRAPDDPALAALAEVQKVGEPLCGRVQPDKLELLFGARAGDVHSAALLPLAGRGVLAIGSSEPNRFYPGMGTLFLRLLGEALATALGRFDATDGNVTAAS